MCICVRVVYRYVGSVQLAGSVLTCVLILLYGPTLKFHPFQTSRLFEYFATFIS